MMRRNFEPAAVREKPMLAQFGLPSDFSTMTYEREMNLLTGRRERFVNGAIIFCIAASLLALVFYSNRGDSNAFMTATALAFPMLLFLGACSAIIQFIAPKLVKSEAWELSFGREFDAYNAAVADWQFTQTEAGFGYWRDLRGVAFEHAIAQFFNRRGCSAELTKATGDGGIDVVLKIGTQTYWCQCKGHEKPVPVGEIRRVAGTALKSRGTALPVIFASNGYTDPARTEARELGVICIDGLRLTQLARASAISTL